MSSRYWIKAWIEILDDPKMGGLDDRAWRRAVELFLVAGEVNDGGHIPETGQLAWRLRCGQDELAQDLATLERVRIVERNGNGWLVRRFADRQAPVSARDRQRQHRERQNRSQYYGHARVTIRDTESESESESEQIRATPSDLSRNVTPSADAPQSELWSAVQAELAGQMARETFETWLAGALLLSTDDPVRVGLRTEYARQWCATRLHHMIRATLARHLHRPELAVQYEVIQ